MRSLILPTALVALVAASAHADQLGAAATPSGSAPAQTPKLTGSAPPTVETGALPVAIGVNFPANWRSAESVAASVYIGVTRQDAIRLNVASYANHTSALVDVIGLAAGGDGDESSRNGRINDVGVGLVHYSHSLWDGFTFELGALRRARDIRVTDDFAPAKILSTNTTTYAARALFGWSWLVKQHAFIAFGVGMSCGLERGTEHIDNGPSEMKTQDVDRSDVAFEGYLRFGGAFGQ
jgi:hypothetical protein